MFLGNLKDAGRWPAKTQEKPYGISWGKRWISFEMYVFLRKTNDDGW